MDTERLRIDPSGMGRIGGEEQKETKVPIPKGKNELLGGLLVDGYTERSAIYQAQHPPNQDPFLRYMERLKKEVKLGDGYQVVTPKVLVDVDNLRLDGKNYGIWHCNMNEHVLDNLRGVLYRPRPSFVVETEASVEEIARSKAAEEKWNEYDALCFHTILNHLSDDLFLHYSKRRKKTSAEQLWHELELRFGGHESRVQKYLEFHLLEEEEPMVEQVEEIDLMFGDLVECDRIAIDEEFHVNAIISKLPVRFIFTHDLSCYSPIILS
ncbi:hypothetical protein CerSpe_084290 [Prunus speciosa]